MSTDSSHPDPDDGHGDGVPDDALLPGTPIEPIADPGLGEHVPRPTDVDPDMERRAERQVAGMFMAAGVLAILFVVAYFAFSPNPVSAESFLGVGASNLSLGLTLGLSLTLIGIGAIQWARKLMSDHELVEYRHSAASVTDDREAALTAFRAGAEESGFGRRKLVRNSMLGAMAMLGLPAIVVLRDLGTLPGDKLEHTVWKKGVRVVNDVTGKLIRPADIQIGQLINAEPSLFFSQHTPPDEVIEGVQLQVEKTKAAVIVVRMLPDDITPYDSRKDWGIDGILCYSKICTHVGCPISLWEQQTHMLLCPCHQSTFDLGNNGKVAFGPAARSLPQLHLGLDDEGYLIAMSDFEEPVGPSFWERG